MPETLREVDSITLFGREVEDMSLAAPKGQAAKDRARLVRVYGFTVDGAYFEMSAATLFVLDGEGMPAMDCDVRWPDLDDDSKFLQSLRAWTVQPHDESVRLDVQTGRFEDLLSDGGGGLAGARGSGARVAGARVAGARVAGARVSGARVAGARLSGMRDPEE